MAPPPSTLSSSRSTPSLHSSPHRPALRPGTLQRLLRPPAPDPSSSDDLAGVPTPRSRSRSGPRATRDRVLLQVTNITPALAGADPFSAGHHGFFLRLSDSSRSCYVSLHADHDNLILANGLHIGQVIEVDSLTPSVPAPVLRNFRVLPGRYPCVQHQDSGGDDDEVKVKEVVPERPRRPSPTPPLPERRARQGGSPASIGHRHKSKSVTNLSEAGSSPASAARRRESLLRSLDSPRGLRKISVPSAGDGNSTDDDDTSDVSSSYSLLSTARRNWDFNGSIKDVSPSKSGSKPTAHQNDVANDPLESVRRKAEKAFKVLSRRNSHASSTTPRDSSCAAAMTRSASSSGIKWCDNNVMWSSLSSSLVQHGKEAMKQSDMALQAVLDGLLEATATEKLIKCLSKYSELQYERTTTQRSSSTASSGSPKAAAKTALDRKQSAISWVRAAVEADLSHFSSHTRVAASESTKASVAEPKPVSPLFCSKPKCNCNSRPSKKNADGSTEASGLNAALELATAMRSDCNRWFLKYIDKFLDDIESETGYATCDSQVAGLLQQLKKVDDWLNRVVRHERMFSIDRGSKDSVLSEEEESDACERVRRKIYGALLRHVQYAAMALESIGSVTDEEKEQASTAVLHGCSSLEDFASWCCPMASSLVRGADPLAANDGVLPTDVLREILLRVPAMALCRLRLVCRSWRSLTSDPRFATAHTARHPLLVGLESGLDEIHVIDLYSGSIVKRIRDGNGSSRSNG
ncbi:hypothetical protein HU200_054848 [Digitaria exilis]|uniref:F-box domain-containing protein n=1 Tax=Digitaria exilis TaxID=1010633 RepID=A0A835AF73_9POAL|nr:hypothetical protein HU200_054848 [Digitaria exilis]